MLTIVLLLTKIQLGLEFKTTSIFACEQVESSMGWFESLLLAPATILGTPAEAGLNQKNSTSLTLGTQTAFDFHPPPADLTPRYSRRLYPKMLNGARKNLSNL
jgi:hypothetical protein